MKKLLILLALAACAACNTEDDNDNRQKATFGGTLTITSNQTPSATPFVTNNLSSTYKCNFLGADNKQ